MIDHIIIEQVNRAIEGQMDLSELAEFEHSIQSNPEAMGYLAEQKRLAEQLAEIGEVEPPPAIKANVMKHISAARPKARPTETTSIRSFIASMAARPSFTFAFGMAAGLFLMFVGINGLDDRTPLDQNSLTGTIVGDVADRTDLKDRQTIQVGSMNGEISTVSGSGITILNINIVSGEGELAVIFNPDEISVRGISEDNETSGQFAVARENVRISHRGTNKYMISFVDQVEHASPVTIIIKSDSHQSHVTVMPAH